MTSIRSRRDLRGVGLVRWSTGRLLGVVATTLCLPLLTACGVSDWASSVSNAIINQLGTTPGPSTTEDIIPEDFPAEVPLPTALKASKIDWLWGRGNGKLWTVSFPIQDETAAVDGYRQQLRDRGFIIIDDVPALGTMSPSLKAIGQTESVEVTVQTDMYGRNPALTLFVSPGTGTASFLGTMF